MTSVQYMTSPEEISKRFRLSNGLSKNTFQETDEILLPCGRKGLLKNESIKEYSYTIGIGLNNAKSKDLHNDTVVVDSCIDASIEQSAVKGPLGKVYKDTEDKVLNCKDSDKTVVKQTCDLGDTPSSKDFNKPNIICFNAIDFQTSSEYSRTPHKYLTDKTEFSLDSATDEIANVVNETCYNLKVSANLDQISLEKKSNFLRHNDNWTNEFPRKEKLKSIHQERCNSNVRIFEEFHKKSEYHDTVGVCLEKSTKNSLSLKSIGETFDSLETNKQGQFLVDVSNECNYSEIKVNSVRSLEKAKLDDAVNILENPMLGSTFALEKNKTKSKLYSLNYKMFSNVIQKARNKVKPRIKPIQSSIGITEEFWSNKNTFTLTQLGKYSKSYVKSESKPSTKSKLSAVLYDMEEFDEFLDFCSEELTHMMSHYYAVSEMGQFLLIETEYVEISLQNVQHAEFLRNRARKTFNDLDTEDFQFVVDGIQRLGNSILTDLIEHGKTWRQAIDIYKINLDIVTDTAVKFCCIPIETTLVSDRDLVYAVFNEVKTQLSRAQAIQSYMTNLYHTESAKMCNIRKRIKGFKQMNNKLSNLVDKFIL